jgi:protein-S-isoprenylcysteine O-methyltransferase Ste14
MKTDPGALLYLSGLLTLVVLRWPYARRWRRNDIVVRRVDASETALLAFEAFGALVLPVIRIFTRWLDFAEYPAPRLFVWSAAALLVPAFALFWRSHADLGRNWSPTLEMHAEHELVTRGIYARIRHPMYAALWSIALAQTLGIPNWVAGPAGMLSFGLMYFVRVPREEAMLVERFGEAYRNYVARTGSLWPRRMRSTRLGSDAPLS